MSRMRCQTRSFPEDKIYVGCTELYVKAGITFDSEAGEPVQIVELLASEKGWWRWRRQAEMRKAEKFLDGFEPEPPKEEPVKAAESPSSISKAG